MRQQQAALATRKAAAKADHPELKILRDQDVIRIADQLAAQIHKETGQYPTITSLLGLIAEEVRPDYERLKVHFGAPQRHPRSRKASAQEPNHHHSQGCGHPAGTGAKDVDWRENLARQLQENLDKTG